MSGNGFAAEVLDREALLNRVEDDWELLATLLDVFMGQERGLRTTIARAFESGELPGIASAAHSLAGTLSTLSATSVHRAAKQIEVAARTGDIDEARRAYDVFQESYGSFHEDLVALRAECEARAPLEG